MLDEFIFFGKTNAFFSVTDFNHTKQHDVNCCGRNAFAFRRGSRALSSPVRQIWEAGDQGGWVPRAQNTWASERLELLLQVPRFWSTALAIALPTINSLILNHSYQFAAGKKFIEKLYRDCE